ncbi:MAG: flagellar basal body L-ring protein FlgH [Gammaproteobacteria bacterium]|nr:flagellar basal body L-ring protein FlgH [Gammaproteobacteria bacterium]
MRFVDMKTSRIFSVALLVLSLGLQACSTVVGPSPGEMPPAVPLQPVMPTGNSGSNYNQGTALVLFGDVRARHVGDTLTVILAEQTTASKSANTAFAKDSDFDAGSPVFAGAPFTSNGDNILNNSWETEQNFDGSGSSSQSNSLTGDITVTVHQVFPNGNLLVMGEKWIMLNRGKEYVQVSGIVRPYDVTTANTVPSGKLADARITYSGKGELADANRAGAVSRIFNKFWPL